MDTIIKNMMFLKWVEFLPASAYGTASLLWTAPFPSNITDIFAVLTAIRLLWPSRQWFVMKWVPSSKTSAHFEFELLFVTKTDTDSNDEDIENRQRYEIPQTVSDLTATDHNVRSLRMHRFIKSDHLGPTRLLWLHRQHQSDNDKQQSNDRRHSPCFPGTTIQRRESVSTSTSKYGAYRHFECRTQQNQPISKDWREHTKNQENIPIHTVCSGHRAHAGIVDDLHLIVGAVEIEVVDISRLEIGKVLTE